MTFLAPSLDEQDLVERLRRREPEAIELLMARFTDRTYRLAHGIVRNAADAEEVVQDVFVSVIQKIGTFEGRAGLWTWIYRVTTNAALNKRRGKRREVEVPLEAPHPGTDLIVEAQRSADQAAADPELSGRIAENAVGVARSAPGTPAVDG